jgi:glucose dehydrogenase
MPKIPARQAVALLAGCLPVLAQAGTAYGDWHDYGGEAQSTKCSPLDRIARDNVEKLQTAWTWKAMNFGPRADPNYEVAPLAVNGVPYIAVHEHAQNGARRGPAPDVLGGGRRTHCAFEEHAQNGALREPVPNLLGGARHALCAIEENIPGFARGYDVHTGQLLWTFHAVARPGDFGHETWENGAWKHTGNTGVWAILAEGKQYIVVAVGGRRELAQPNSESGE